MDWAVFLAYNRSRLTGQMSGTATVHLPIYWQHGTIVSDDLPMLMMPQSEIGLGTGKVNCCNGPHYCT